MGETFVHNRIQEFTTKHKEKNDRKWIRGENEDDKTRCSIFYSKKEKKSSNNIT